MMSQIILLVEDNPSDVRLTKRSLEQNKITNKLSNSVGNLIWSV